jgi:hypothetical protein
VKANTEIEPMVGLNGLLKVYPVSRRTIERWIGKGCPSRLIDGRRLFRISKVEKWMIKFNQGTWLD